MRRLAVALTVLVLAASVPTAVGQTEVGQTAVGQAAVEQASGQAYAGTHVSFDTSSRAVTDYAVHGEAMLDSVKVQSASEVEDGLVDLETSLSAVTEIEGAGLAVGAKTTTEARVNAESGATIAAHDNRHGILVVAPGDQSEYVVADLSAGANASAESDSQVTVTTENGTNATLLVVGDGNLTVNDEGDVTARLAHDGRLVFRAYPDGKDEGEEKREKLVAEGTAKAEAYVMAENESGNESEEMVVDTVSYGENTSIEVAWTAKNGVALAVNRTTHEGTVVVTSVSEAALNASDPTVTVDGEAAVKARTYTQLESALGSSRSRYVVRGDGSANTDVLVAVNHFSERTVAMTSANEQSEAETTTDAMGETTAGDATPNDETTESSVADETTSDDEAQGSDENTGGTPGFTVTAALVALLAGALLARVQ